MLKKLILSAAILTSTATLASAADQIRIVGSSTVYPFTTSVSEQFGKKNPKFKTPIVESTGTGGGFKLFCEGVSETTPDISNASRRIKPDELLTCRKNGVNDITEIKIGYDGIVVANSAKSPKFTVTLKDLFLALGRKVPSQDGKQLVDNFYKTWDQINPAYPKQKIQVYGFPPSSGTRDTFTELALESVCVGLEPVKAAVPESEARKTACKQIREDGVYIETGEDGNIIVHKLDANKDALGIIGFSFLQTNPNVIQAATVNGVVPTRQSVSDASYVLSRSLYVYVKRAHIGKVSGIEQFVSELISDETIGEFGYLIDKGLIALPSADLKVVQADVKAGKTLQNLAEEAPSAKAAAPAAAKAPAAAAAKKK